MLSPHDRLSVYDIVRPPRGWSVEAVLALTYSVSLDTVLSLPAAIVADLAGPPSGAQLAPMHLAALRRICEHTLIFCQAGAVHGAEAISPAVVELETMVHGVTVGDASFHPKVWLVRFCKGEGPYRRSALRLAISSRNLTSDTSWDAGIVLDGRHRPGAARPDALAGLLRALPELCTRPLTLVQRAHLASFADGLESTTWLLPQGIRDLKLRVLGAPVGTGWMPPRNDRMVVLSPFLHKSTLEAMSARSGEPLALLSRRPALDQVWSATAPFGRKAVFAPADGSDLHAKIYVWDAGPRTRVAVGSMNATRPATGGANVEVMAEVDCTRLLDGGGSSAFLERIGMLMEDYAPPPGATELEDGLDDRPARRALLACRPFLRCEAEGGLWKVSLESEAPLDRETGACLGGLSFRPVTLTEGHAVPCHEALLGRRAAILSKPLELHQVTGFVAFRSTDVPIYLTLNLQVLGVSLDERRDAVLRDLLPSREGVYALIRLMLGDVSGLEGSGGGSDGAGDLGKDSSFAPVGLLELLVRCAADDPSRLGAVAKVVEALDVLRGDELDDFRRVWTGVRFAAGAAR